MPTTLTGEEIKMILNRDPELEAQRLFHGANLEVNKRYLWENRFDICFSSPTNHEDIQKALGLGMIEYEKLVDGHYYWGISRNCRVAKWDKSSLRFVYRRCKGSVWITNDACYPGVDEEYVEFGNGKITGFDLFLPYLPVDPKGDEVVIEDAN